MQDFEALRARVEETARRMIEAQTERSEKNRSLVDVLARLERKYTAQQEELAFYKARIAPLERTNAQLSNLMTKLLDMVDTGFGEDSLEPLRRASAMASAMLEQDLVVPPQEKPAEDAAPAPAPGAKAPVYEDVAPDALGRDAAAGNENAEELPDFVRRSLAEVDETPAPERQSAPPGDGGGAPDGETEPEESAEVIFAEATDSDAPAAPETVQTVDALAKAIGRKSDAGESLDESDITALLARVETLARRQAEHEDGFDIPPTADEEDADIFSPVAPREKTGTEG